MDSGDPPWNHIGGSDKGGNTGNVFGLQWRLDLQNYQLQNVRQPSCWKFALSLSFLFFGEVCNYIAVENLNLNSSGHFGAQLRSPVSVKNYFIKLSNPQ